jgi:long-chain acyl-CoA synthetase
MAIGQTQPWLQYYSDEAKTWSPRFDNMLSAFRAAVSSGHGGLRYFGNVFTWADIDRASDRLSVWALEQGVKPGDRISIILQNVPSFVIATVAAWKLGATPTPGNPMYRTAELTRIFADSRPSLVICHEDHAPVVDEALAAVGLKACVRTVAAADHAGSPDARIVPPPAASAPRSLMPILNEGDKKPPHRNAAPEDLCLLLYTSGTTGVPKGAMLRHESIAANAQHTGDWCGVHTGSRVLGIAPFFHITGFVCHIGVAMLTPCELISYYRFEPSVVLDVIRRERPTYSIGAITAFNALASQPTATREDFASFEQVYSGGAPIAPALQSSIREKLGININNCYGMTETAAPTHFTPRGRDAPVDPTSGALSIGVPGYGTDVKVVDEEGRDLAPGEIGELWLKGRQIMVGYWQKPEETRAALVDGWMRSGDVGFMDENGWFYLVDRKKDVIIASGFKVWPREVEDALYSHPAVREAAVVGEADSYRGETVIAYVSLRPGSLAEPSDLTAHCRKSLAGYKCPRDVRILDELPKTVTGKIQRNVLRERSSLGVTDQRSTARD